MLHQSPKVKKDVLQRLNYLIGHLNGVRKMVDDDKYCIDIVKQTQAVQAALDKTVEIILEDHLKTCVSAAIKKGKGTKHIQEIMDAIKHHPKRK